MKPRKVDFLRIYVCSHVPMQFYLPFLCLFLPLPRINAMSCPVLFNKVWRLSMDQGEQVAAGNEEEEEDAAVGMAPGAESESESAPAEAMLPWSAVTPAAWEETKRNSHCFKGAGDCGSGSASDRRQSFQQSLRLRRGACLDWDLIGIALFAYYLWVVEHGDAHTTTTHTSTAAGAGVGAGAGAGRKEGGVTGRGAGAGAGEGGGYVWSVHVLLPAAFLLLGHPVVRSQEGLRCAALLPPLASPPSLYPPLPLRPAPAPAPAPSPVESLQGHEYVVSTATATASSSSASASADADADITVDALPVDTFQRYVSSILSFDWRDDVVVAFVSVQRQAYSSLEEFVTARWQCVQKGAYAIALQNTFLLCQLIVNAIVSIVSSLSSLFFSIIENK
jgi:hypothetical protein